MDRFDTAVQRFDGAAAGVVPHLTCLFYKVVVEALIKIVHSLPARETESRFRD